MQHIQDALKAALDPKRPYAIFDFPNHGNVGDSAIWQGEQIALRLFFGVGPVTSRAMIAEKSKFPKLSTSTQIIIHGGGNLGDLWEIHQNQRERILEAYPQNRIVQLPQSIFFQEKHNLERCRISFSRHRDFTLMVRDQESYEIAKTLHAGNPILAPDMALGLGFLPRPNKPSAQILGLLRNDHEKAIKDDQEVMSKIRVLDWTSEPVYAESLILFLVSVIDNFTQSSWKIFNALRYKLFDKLSAKRVRRGCEILSLGQVVITDRLHAHILCALMGVPNVVLENNYGKLRNVSESSGTFKAGGSYAAEDIRRAYEISQALLEKNT